MCDAHSKYFHYFSLFTGYYQLCIYPAALPVHMHWVHSCAITTWCLSRIRAVNLTVNDQSTSSVSHCWWVISFSLFVSLFPSLLSYPHLYFCRCTDAQRMLAQISTLYCMRGSFPCSPSQEYHQYHQCHQCHTADNDDNVVLISAFRTQ